MKIVKLSLKNSYKGENVTFVLSTANKIGKVSSRVMYLADLDDNAIYFATSKTSISSQNIIENPNA
jgi:pyridoxine/pyridoxamine 5'-phosphate oxidase